MVTLVAFVLVIWIGRRYADMEELPEGPGRDKLAHHLYRLDELWPLGVVLFSSLSIVLCWVSLPPGA